MRHLLSVILLCISFSVLAATSTTPPKGINEIRPPKQACASLTQEAVILITAQSLGATQDRMTERVMIQLTNDGVTPTVKGWYFYLINFIFNTPGSEVEKLKKFIANCTGTET